MGILCWQHAKINTNTLNKLPPEKILKTPVLAPLNGQSLDPMGANDLIPVPMPIHTNMMILGILNFSKTSLQAREVWSQGPLGTFRDLSGTFWVFEFLKKTPSGLRNERTWMSNICQFWPNFSDGCPLSVAVGWPPEVLMTWIFFICQTSANCCSWMLKVLKKSTQGLSYHASERIETFILMISHPSISGGINVHYE